jgi:hypothetical protein
MSFHSDEARMHFSCGEAVASTDDRLVTIPNDLDVSLIPDASDVATSSISENAVAVDDSVDVSAFAQSRSSSVEPSVHPLGSGGSFGFNISVLLL